MKYSPLLFAILLKGTLMAQSVNQIDILPANPTATDTILIISDLTYTGNCAFGLVYTYMDTTGSDIRIFPTYCGYWDTTICNSIDTFKIGPFPNGNYTLQIEYHQGSVCPISNFDATIYQLDTSFVVGGTTNVLQDANKAPFPIKIHPNPAGPYLLITHKNFNEQACFISITNLWGQLIFKSDMPQHQLRVDTTDWHYKGVCLVSVFDKKGNRIGSQKIIVQY